MNEDPNPEPAPNAEPTAAERPARKRARKQMVDVPVEAGVAQAAPPAGAVVETARAHDVPAAVAAELRPSEPHAVGENRGDGTVGAPSADGGAESVEGDRGKRSRRRGRRGKENNKGVAQGATAGTHARRDTAPLQRAELEASTRELLGQTFGFVTSDGYDEAATPTDEELRGLEERARVELDVPAEAPTLEQVAPMPSEGGDGVAIDRAEMVADSAEPSPASGGGARNREGRRVLAPQRDAPKLQKVLAQSGAGSRRDIEQWIGEGRVTVNGQTAHTGQRVSFGDKVAIDAKPVRIRFGPVAARVIAYHKPVGEIVTHDDPQQRPTVFRKLPRLMQGKWQSVGRLDINTEGLLLFTNSGELANQLMHPRFGIEREYAVRVLGTLDDEARARLLGGVDIEGQRAAFLAIDDGGGEGVNRWYRVTIAEGRHREVRRLFDVVGLAVSRLIRIRYGAVVLPRGLKRGVWVDLPEGDVRALRRLVGGERDGGDRPDRGDRGPRQQDAPRAGKGRRGRDRGQAPQQHQPRDHQGAERRLPFDPAAQPNRDGRPRRGDRRPDRGNGRAPRGEGPIPNPLMQTYDRRAAQEARRAAAPEYGEDGPIPNPLQQNFDKRAMRESSRVPKRDYGEDGPIPNPLQQTFDKRQVQGLGDPLVLGRRHAKRGGPADGQPDPMQTAVGYIGADAFHTRNPSGRGKGQGRRKR